MPNTINIYILFAITGENYVNPKNTGKGKGKMKKYKDEDVYENVEEKVGNGRPTSQSTVN
jgi:hypothetical protein